MQVLKYQVPGSIILPTSAKEVLFNEQNGVHYLWVQVDVEETPQYPRTYKVFATGAIVNGRWIASYQANGEVWHLYETQ